MTAIPHFTRYSSEAGALARERHVWATAEGEEIAIPDLGDRHLRNIIRMLERQAPGLLAAETSAAWSLYSCLQGEMAIDAMENEIDALFEMTPQDYLASDPAYQGLTAEAARRGLTW